MKKPLQMAGIGCGGRTRTYLSLARERFPERYEVVAAADPRSNRVEQIRRLPGCADIRTYDSDTAFFDDRVPADVVVIGTQDRYHVEPALRAIRAGYDLLLEKPIACRPEDVLLLDQAAREAGTRVVICHVLRFTSFYREVKRLLDGGEIGEIHSVRAQEGVGPWHFAHSFVRGHWSHSDKSSPMVVAKCCHDLDILCWLIGKSCTQVSSTGSLSHFNPGHRPEGAPDFCVSGCPAAPECPYDARRYLGKERAWLRYVFDEESDAGESGGTSRESILQWLSHSDWGRCVYSGRNNQPDHQTVLMEFTGGTEAQLTLSAFTHGRDLEVHGSLGILRAGEAVKRDTGADILIEQWSTGAFRKYNVPTAGGGYGGHHGGDFGLVQDLYRLFDRETDPVPGAYLDDSVESHVIGFAAEEARVTGKTIDLKAYRSAAESRVTEASGTAKR